MNALLEIDLAAVVANWRLLAAMSKGSETAAVVKADAYGLGAAQVAPALAKAGCKTFFAATLEEAVALRPLLPGARILTLNGLSPYTAADFVAHEITPVLATLRDIALWRAQALAMGRELPAFLHLETGLHRLALDERDLTTLREDASLLAGLRVDTVMSHLVSGEDPADPRNQQQLALFSAYAAQFPGAKRSLANSAGSFLGAAFQLDLTRPGAALYGLNVSLNQPHKMHSVLHLSAPILQVHEIPVGATVGYGGTWVAQRPSRIATIGVGYADGLLRSLSSRGYACFNNVSVPLVGRVSMDLATFDITDVPAMAGERLVLLGPQHGADELGLEAGALGYEMITSLGRRYQRRYSGV